MQAAVGRAIQLFLEHDHLLLRKDVNERTIAAALAHHLRLSLREYWHVDVEYNKDGHDPKRVNLSACPNIRGALRTGRVYPDIVVHQRGTTNNLLVLELKKSTNRESRKFDLCKLEAYQRDLNYRFGAFVEMLAGGDSAGVLNLTWLP